MNKEQQRYKIAEACGWKPDDDGAGLNTWEASWVGPRLYGLQPSRRSDGTVVSYTVDCLVPDYLNDLNEMHEAEVHTGMHYDQRWVESIVEIAFRESTLEFERTDGWDWVLLVARLTAEQRAEPLLKALNLWEDDEYEIDPRGHEERSMM